VNFKAVQYKRKSNAMATDNQLSEILKIPKREFMRRGINQHTLEKICAQKPVRVAKLADCLKVIEELKTEKSDAVQRCRAEKGMGAAPSVPKTSSRSRIAVH
jgi:hypothetical protein